MAIEKKTFLFNAKNVVFTANITETLKQDDQTKIYFLNLKSIYSIFP